MRGLLKFLFLVSSFCLNLSSALINDDGKSFSELLNDPYRGYNRGKDWGFPYKSDYSTTLLNSNVDVKFIGNEFVRIDNNYYRISQKSDFIFNLRHKNGSGYNLFDYSGNQSVFILQYYSGEFEQAKIKCWVNGNYVQTCGPGLSDAQDETFSYFNQWYIEYKATCDSSKNEIFSKKLFRCVSCPAGQSWDDDGGKCFIDCTDEKTNKWGWSDGSCTDCSAAKTDGEVFKCFCGSLGLGVPETFESLGVIGKPGYFQGKCSDGNTFEFKSPDYKPDTPKPDDNKTKPDDPKPKPDPGGDSGGGNGGDSGGGNSGGSQDKPNPDPGNNDEFCKKNPNDPKCKKSDNNSTAPGPGGGSGGGGGNKDGDAKFNPGDFNYSDKKREYEDFKNRYGQALNKVLENFDGFKQGVDQFISNVQGKGLASADKQSKPTTCVKKYDIDFFGYKSSIEFDFCKVASSVSGAFYYIFYAFFFYCFLILIVKILLFAF